ncbi:MAG TPA: UDP-N-acetylmuramoyl-L-alanyl-D-glutamate--2,6-diaminopimelate ligase, partial [Burkholderiales bacterium]|nr:UDP-N-acetylmuramoyl-L-alanyl-D-glutamate--2,6-diaminopimelate ligase [Burkholderiales bacterium]
MDVFRELAAQGAMIDRLSSDSRRCAPGVAFLAYPGEASDGRAYIGDALARGAAAVLWEKKGLDWLTDWRVPNFAVDGLKQQASALAHEFYGRPSERLWVCGVTGTNGKTSCSQWVAALLDKAAIIGTLGAGFPGALSAATNTTPDAVETQFLLKNFLDQGAKAVAMEVSSHGLVQGRVSGVRFSCALFTNLSHDHLDYHGSMANYAAAKARLFEMPGLENAVLNLDDALGVELARRLAGRVRTIGYSLSAREIPVDEAVVAGRDVDPASLPVLGRFNVANALGVLGCLVAKGIPVEEGARLLAKLPPVPGRMQAVSEAPLVVIDYAHTPDALQNVLQALRPVAAARGGRLAVVFGAGGDRDPSKRPLMGGIAARFADRVLITSDNPRSEDPLMIIEQIRKAIRGAHEVEADRAHAIEKAIVESSPSDVVLIAGKGHETYQEIAGRRIH